MINKLICLLFILNHLNAAPCKSYSSKEECKAATHNSCKHTTTCPPTVSTTPCVDENKRDLWSYVQPILLALYILLAALLVLLLCSFICRMCSQLFVMCGCDTWFRPCFCVDSYSDMNCSLITSSMESCPCENKTPLCKK